MCLITGGAGFIGCALSAGVADRFEQVVAMDNLHPQVHSDAVRPAALDRRVRLVVADVTSAEAWDRVLAGAQPHTVIHLAAETSTAQSLTQATRHGSVNVVGTTQMVDALSRHGVRPERIVLASSRAVYGEGAWRDSRGDLVYPGQRPHSMLAAGTWDFPGLMPVPANAATVEPRPSSVYAATKLAQEHLVRVWALAMGVTSVVLRLQNVYGAGQSMANPYTGILPFFAQLARRGQEIPLYEDGLIVRDFVHVDDVVRALVLALDVNHPGATQVHVDIGSGLPTTISQVAGLIAARYSAPEPRVTGQFRDGDVRYACADPSAVGRALGWAPEMSLTDGIDELCEWVHQASDRL